MLIRAEPVALALESIGILGRPAFTSLAVVLTAPTGLPFNQAQAEQFASLERVVFLCGHYEGFDHRVETQLATHVVSIGDFVLTNGELPALTMADSVVRLLPKVLGSADSLTADSHSDGLLSAPNYTRPDIWRGEPVPEVLKGGNHQAISKWRRQQSLLETRSRRPDLLARAHLEKSDLDVLSS
jgi:tRNA (guanine37-N1)-methyltransferase